MNNTTNDAFCNAIVTEFKIDRNNSITESDISPSDWQACTLITQNLDDANSFLNKYSVNHKFQDSFDPHGYWIGVNVNKVKIKWRTCPNQWTDNDSNIYSIFHKKDYRILTGQSWKLVVIPTIEPGFAICIGEYVGQRQGLGQQPLFTKTSLAIENIMQDITTNYVKDEETDAILIPHLKKTITRSFLPVDAEKIAQDAGLNLTCHECIDHYRITLDSHGLYINRLIRNKIRTIEDPGSGSVTINPDYLWVKNIITGDVIFSLDLKS